LETAHKYSCKSGNVTAFAAVFVSLVICNTNYWWHNSSALARHGVSLSTLMKKPNYSRS